jgi:hypothetical protein
MQTTPRKAVLDRLSAQSHFKELSASDHAVLLSRQSPRVAEPLLKR